MKTSLDPNMIGRIKSWIAKHLPRSWVLPLARLTSFSIRRHSLEEEAHKVYLEDGFYFLPKHYYLPIPEEADLDTQLSQKPSELIGLSMNDDYALELLEKSFPSYAEEFRRTFPLHNQNSSSFYLINGSFMAIDAHVYYSLIRHSKPRRIVEVGAGNSTLVAVEGCRRNLDEFGHATSLTAIDPYPPATLKGHVPGLSQLIEAKIQEISMDTFTTLESGDILFIDSTHVLRQGGDVQLEYCEILPRLAPGVLVHIHDISLPKAYPRVYFEQRLYWNEQYLLQAFLAFNSRFEVIWPGNYMMLKYPERVCAVFPEYWEMRKVFPMSEPSSFWIRVRQDN